MSREGRICPSCRATLLSRYDSEPLCGPCLKAARHMPVQFPTWVWDSEPMRRALARLDLGAVIAVPRAAAGLTQAQMAELVPGWTRTKETRIESGERGTLFDIRELLAWADAVAMPREALLPVILGRPDATLEDTAELPGEKVHRREFHGMAAGLLTAAVLPNVPVPDRVDAAQVRYLRATVDRLQARDQMIGGGAIFQQALTQFGQARRI